MPEGTETENLRVLPEEAWDDELRSTAEEVYWRTGKAVQYVLGSIEVRDGAGDIHRVRGVWTPDGDIIIQADNMRVSARQIGEHESYHSIAAEHPGTDAEIERRIREQFSEEEFDAVVETYIQRLHGIVDLRANASGAEFEAALARVKQEIFADAYAGINAFGAHADRYRDTAREVVKERTRGEYRGEIEEATRDTTGPPDGRYSIDENYEREIDDWNRRGRPAGEVFILGETGDVLQSLGAMEQDIYLNSKKANEIMEKHPEMTLNEIKRIPEVLDDPVLVLSSRNVGRERSNTRLVIFGSVIAEDGLPVMAVLDLRPYEGRLLVDDMQRVTSAYTKDNNPVSFIMNSEALYADKKRAAALLRRVGFQMPTGLLRNGYIGSISYDEHGVNIEGVPFNEIVQSEDTTMYSVSMKKSDTAISENPSLGAERSTAPGFKDSVSDNGENVNSRYSINDELPVKSRFSLDEDEAADEHARQALEYFGSTYRWNETGYITRDGRRLDFSGRHEGGPGGYRTVDHREIGDALGEDYGSDEYSGAMVRFMAEGNIRISPEGGGINLSVRPTRAQEQSLSDFISRERGEVTLDIDRTDGETVSSTEYPRGTHSSKVISDIRNYFDTGETPKVSEVARYRYSIDEDYEREIDDWDRRGRPDGEVFILGETGEVLQGLGAMEQSIFLRSKKVNTILREHPEMTLDEIKRVPKVLDDPILVAKSAGSSRSGRNSRLTIMGNLRAQNGRPVMTVLDLRPVEGRLLIDDMQKINSAYTRDNAANYLRRSEILYVDAKRTIPLLRSAGLTIASRQLLQDGSMGSITYDGTEVNIEGVPFDEIVRTEDTPRYSIDEETPAERDEDAPEERRRRTARPVAESRPIIASRDLKRDIYTQFSIPPGERGEISRLLDGFTDKLIRTGKLTEADRSELFDRLYAAGVMSVPADEYYGVGREAVINRRMYVDPSTRADFGDDWNNIRRRAFGSGIYLTSDTSDMAADQWNMELAEMLPGLFNAEETDPRTIIERVIQVAEEGRDEQMSLAEYTSMLAEQEHISEDEVLNEMERQLDWDLRTFAREANLEIKLRDRTGVKIAQERERYAESKNRARERRLAREAEDRAHRKELAEKRRQDRELKQLQQRTLTQLRWLARNQNKAPADLRETWNEVLGDIDIFAVNAANEMRWSNKYQATWRDIADMVKAAKNDKNRYPNFFPSAELERIANRVDKDKIADMDIGTLQDLYKAAVGLRTEFYNRNNVIKSQKAELFSEVYRDAKRDIEKAPGGYTGKKLERFVNIEQLTPMNVLERMAGWNPDSAFYSMAKQLEQGEMDVRAYNVQANQLLEEFLNEYKDWVQRSDGQGKDAIWYDYEMPKLLELGFGDRPVFSDTETVKFSMTPAQKVQLYLESKNYDNLRHIAGGRVFPDKKLYSEGKRSEAFNKSANTKVHLAPETVRKLVEDLTPEERELASILERYYNDFAAKRINEVSNVLYGYDKAISKNYAPIYTDPNFNHGEVGIYDVTAEGVGNMKERIQGSKNPSLNISAYDAFERHVDQTARFVGMAIPARNWNTLLNWGDRENTMSSIIANKWGGEGVNYIKDLLVALQGGGARDRAFAPDSVMDKALSNYISAVFGANPGIVLKQLGSVPLAAAYLGMENFPKPSQVRNIDRELIRKYTSELDWRMLGYSTPETKQLKNRPNWSERNKFTRFVFGGGAITAMDGWAASTLWPWAENKVRREHPELELGTPEQIEAGQSPFYKTVAEEFNSAVVRSQSMPDEMHQSGLRKSRSPVVRAFTMFKTDSAQLYNTLRQKIGEAQYYKREKASEKVQHDARRAAGSAFIAALTGFAWVAAIDFLMNLWKYGGKNYRDDEDELTAESVIKAMVLEIVGSMAGTVTGGEELADIIGAALLNQPWYGIDIPGGEQLNDVIDKLIGIFKDSSELISGGVNVLNNDGDLGDYFSQHSADVLGAFKEIAETVATYFPGVPLENVEKYLVGLVRNISPELAVAYEDALSAPNKQGLDGLEGDALTTRVKDILLGRVAELSDEMAERLAKLYADGYTGVVPSSTPTQITVDGTSYELDAYAQQVYNNVWSDTMGASLDELIAAPEFRSANRAQQTSMIKKLYSYADATARDEVIDAYRPADWVAELDEDLAAGGSLSEWAMYDVLADGMSSTFDKLTDAGLRNEQALDVAENIAGLGEDATTLEQYMAVARMPISEFEKELALEGIMTESAFAKYSAAREAGIYTYEYCNFLDTIDGYSGDGRQERVWAYIDSLPLTSAQKDALHLAAGYRDTTLYKTPWHR